MRVLVVHSRSRSGPISGENIAVDTETAAMRSHGWDVRLLQASSDDLLATDRSLVSRAKASPRAVWNRDAVRRLREVLVRFRPDVVHMHNDFPQIGPAIHQALARWGIPYLQTIHNYRFACVNSALFRDGRLCTNCVTRRFALPGILHRCGNSTARSAYVAGWMLANHRARSLGNPLLVANSQYVATQLVAHGAQPDRVTYRYNLAWPKPSQLVPRAQRRGVIAASRLDEFKGIDLLVAAWKRANPDEKLTIIGDGPQREFIRHLAAGRTDIEMIGTLPHGELLHRLAHARVVVVPSRLPEPFGRIAMEALHHGTPALVSDVGGLPEAAMLPELVVPPDDESALAERLLWALETDELPSVTALAREAEASFGLGAFLDRTQQLFARVSAEAGA